MPLPRNNLNPAPRPQFIVMTDRADGTQWLLSHDASGDYITINDQGLLRVGDITTPYTDVKVYGPDEGPYVRGPRPGLNLRLLVRGGYLGFEEAPAPVNSNARVLTRRGLSGTLREIVCPSDYKDGAFDILAWEDEP